MSKKQRKKKIEPVGRNESTSMFAGMLVSFIRGRNPHIDNQERLLSLCIDLCLRTGGKDLSTEAIAKMKEALKGEIELTASDAITDIK